MNNSIEMLSRIPAGFETFDKPSIQPQKPSEAGFGDFLKNSMDEVNRLLQSADTKASDMATGKTENLHDAMIDFEKAETAFKLLVQVRSRAIEAYQEIMRMQV